MSPLLFDGPDGETYQVESDHHNVTLSIRREGCKVFQVAGYLRDFPHVAEWLAKTGFNSLEGDFGEVLRKWEILQKNFFEAVDARLGTKLALPCRLSTISSSDSKAFKKERRAERSKEETESPRLPKLPKKLPKLRLPARAK